MAVWNFFKRKTEEEDFGFCSLDTYSPECKNEAKGEFYIVNETTKETYYFCSESCRDATEQTWESLENDDEFWDMIDDEAYRDG